MAYFTYFPKIAYDLRGIENNKQFDFITNLLSRVLVKCHGWADVDGSAHEALIGVCHFEKYIIKDGDRPDTLAYKFYDDSQLHWLIMYANGTSVFNPWYDWPMKYLDLNKFITKKYGAGNEYLTHHYEDTNGYVVDSTAPNATIVSHYIYEERLNDSKRTIRIIERQYISLVVNEFKRLMDLH